MCRIENKEHGILTKINQSKTIREIQTHIRNWEKDDVLIKKLYKNNEYQNIRIEIQNMIGSIMKLHERDSSLSLIKTDIIERIQSIIDSLAVDLSQARNDALRKWQNSIFPTLHGNLVELIESPNLDKAETIFRDALETNKNGARLLDIDLSELETHQTDTVDFFQNAITSDELINI